MNKLYHSRIFESSDMIRQIAEMWNLNKPGRMEQPEGYVTFQLCFLVKIYLLFFWNFLKPHWRVSLAPFFSVESNYRNNVIFFQNHVTFSENNRLNFMKRKLRHNFKDSFWKVATRKDISNEENLHENNQKYLILTYP